MKHPPAPAARNVAAGTTVSYAAVDLGATSGRVLLAVPSQGITRVVHRFANVPLGQRESLRWNVEQLFQETITGLALAYREAESLGTTLAGIGVDSWGVDYALLREGQLVAPVRHYRRTSDTVMLDALSVMDAASLYSITGVREQPINTLVQLFSDKRQGLLDHVDQFLLVPDLWVFWMTGTLGTEPTIASTTQLFDPLRREWSDEIISAFDLPRHILPTITPTGSVASSTSPWFTTKIGAEKPVPVFRVGSHDTASALAVSRAITGSRTGLVSSGSWTLVAAVTPDPVVTVQSHRQGFTNEQATDGENLHLHNLNGMWLLEECVRAELGPTAQVDMAALVEQARLIEQPAEFDLSAAELFSPQQVARTIDELCTESGFPPPVGLAARARAIFESVAGAIAASVNESGKPDCVSIVGGGARNSLLCELVADRLGVPVLAGPAEATALGNILVQAQVDGLPPSEVAKRLVGNSLITYYPDDNGPRANHPWSAPDE